MLKCLHRALQDSSSLVKFAEQNYAAVVSRCAWWHCTCKCGARASCRCVCARGGWVRCLFAGCLLWAKSDGSASQVLSARGCGEEAALVPVFETQRPLPLLLPPRFSTSEGDGSCPKGLAHPQMGLQGPWLLCEPLPLRGTSLPRALCAQETSFTV